MREEASLTKKKSSQSSQVIELMDEDALPTQVAIQRPTPQQIVAANPQTSLTPAQIAQYYSLHQQNAQGGYQIHVPTSSPQAAAVAGAPGGATVRLPPAYTIKDLLGKQVVVVQAHVDPQRIKKEIVEGAGI